ncbi:hypothetical protein [Candidatus Tisiphia endosymbiont of Hybos culiciformis]|uniref:hypothetical protein n=1 Tax=Candidatus Tisiphia endosymbiont of Hybos culiciformis TaxID=3139331 RepID=UPI003CCB1357
MTTFNSHFTQESTNKIICPKTGQDYYNDTKEDGLLLIASSGKNKSKVFYLRRTVGGKQRHIKLGSLSKSEI